MTSKRLILDAHAHAFPDALAARAVAALQAAADWFPVKAHHDGTVNGLLASMDTAAVQRVAMCSVATRAAQVEKITDWSAAINNPRIIPIASIHPDFERPEEECLRIASLGIPGLKFHPYYMNCPADDPRVIRLAKAAANAGLAMCFHAGLDPNYPRIDLAGPARILRIHHAVPNLRLLACHLGGWMDWENSLELLAGTDVFLESSCSIGICNPDLVKRFFEKHSPHRLMFGTDSPWGNHPRDLDAFLALGLTEQHLHLALWENGHRWAYGRDEVEA